MFDFAEKTKNMAAVDILNYYRNLYYSEPMVTERGIIANAINDFFGEVFGDIRKVAEKLEYKGKMYYLYAGKIYDDGMEIIIEEATNGFLDLYEYFEYFPPNAATKKKGKTR